MRKKALSLALALALALTLLPAAALAAEDSPQRGVLTYTEPIKPQYEAAQAFSEGLAAVRQNGKWGYIDTTGKAVIPFQYDQAYAFHEGKAVVGTLAATDNYGSDGEPSYVYRYTAGFIDQSGRYTPFRSSTGEAVSYVTDSQDILDGDGILFHNGYACLLEDFGMGCAGLYDASGDPVSLTVQSTYGSYDALIDPTTVNEGFIVCGAGFLNLATHRALEPVVDPVKFPETFNISCYPFNQGLGPVSFGVSDGQGGELWYMGFINASGQWVIQPFPIRDYWVINSKTSYKLFGDTGLAMFQNTDGLYGAIDKSGNTVIPFQYQDLRPVGEGRIPFQQNGKYGYLDAGDLSVVIPAQYENATGFSNGLAVVYDGAKAFLIDWNGSPVPGGDRLRTETYFREEDGRRYYLEPDEFVVIQENGKYGYGHVEYLPALPEEDEMSSWAYGEVTAAIEQNLVPVYLQSLYRSSIKRGEFCDLTMQAVTEILGVSAEELVQQRTGKSLSAWVAGYPFNDTSDANIIAAYALDIVGGRGNGTFDPYAPITRQEAAALLTRGAKVLGMDTTVITDAGYADSADVASWARDSVNYAAQINVMNGSGGSFTPAGAYSREQSFMTIYRLYQALLETQG